MSGFEIIGVILSGLPIVIKVAEDYKRGLEPLARWHRYKLEFRTFVNDVDIEKQMFDALVDRLLQYTDLSTEQKEALLTGQDADGWCEAEVSKALRERLGDSYDASMYLLEAMKADMLKLQAILSLKDGTVDWARPDEDKWHYQRKRISHSFSRKGPETVASLVKNNRRLRDLLDVLDQKATTTKSSSKRAGSKDTTGARVFECIRRQASSLHAALQSGWRCTCESPHLVILQLQSRSTGDWSSQFIMVFIASTAQNEAPSRQHRYIITAKQPKDIEEAPTDSKPRPTPVQDDYLIRLKSNMVRQEISEHFAPLSFSTPKTPTLSSWKKGIQIQVSDFKSSISSDRIQLVNKCNSIGKKKIAWTGLPSTGNPEIAAVKSNTDTQPVMNPLSVDDTEQSLEIQDLCSTLFKSNSNSSYLGHLCCTTCHRHVFRSLRDSKPISENMELISLDRLLEHCTNVRRLTRKQRFRLTVVVASSLLQLQNTPWITTKLDKMNIFFEYDPCKREVLAENPYIRHFFYSAKQQSLLTPLTSGADIKDKEVIEHGNDIPRRKFNASNNIISEDHRTVSKFPKKAATNNTTKEQDSQTPSPRSSRFAAKTSLHQLGILLLELCFGQTIESIPLRNNFLINGTAHDQTDFLTALDWKSEVEEEAGEEFKFAINNCFDFELKPDWNDIRFTQSIFLGVVQQLNKALADLGWADSC